MGLAADIGLTVPVIDAKAFPHRQIWADYIWVYLRFLKNKSFYERVLTNFNVYAISLRVRSLYESQHFLQRKLMELLKAVENGERVTICRRGKPVVDLVRHKVRTRGKQRKPKFDTRRDKIIIHDPDWWKPVTLVESDD